MLNLTTDRVVRMLYCLCDRPSKAVKLRYRDLIIDIAAETRLPMHDVAFVFELFAMAMSAARDGRDVEVIITEEAD